MSIFFQISVYVYICDKNTCSKSTPEYNSTKKLSFTQQQRKPCASFFHETHGHTFPYPKRKKTNFKANVKLHNNKSNFVPETLFQHFVIT